MHRCAHDVVAHAGGARKAGRRPQPQGVGLKPQPLPGPGSWCGWFGAVRRTSASLRCARLDRGSVVRSVRGCAAYHVGCAGLPASGRVTVGGVRRGCFEASRRASLLRFADAVRRAAPHRPHRVGMPDHPVGGRVIGCVGGRACRVGGRACRDSVGRDGDGAGRGDQEVSGRGVRSTGSCRTGCGGSAIGGRSSPGGAVGTGRRGRRAGSGRVGRSPRTGVMWSRSQALASRVHHGNTQCLSRRMTSSRIQAGGSWASTASVRAMSRTGWMVTRDRPAQSLIRAMVAGPNLSTVPNPVPSAAAVGAVEPEQVGQAQVEVELGLRQRPAADRLHG